MCFVRELWTVSFSRAMVVVLSQYVTIGSTTSRPSEIRRWSNKQSEALTPPPLGGRVWR